ncbi:MAG: dihydrolipoyllysine-residue acetyltransferase [Candidatus Eremiobacteraeota bacterium]|nr:dihydrolipoyllysine-residue acetyltransferase [Candidatus Eremiobacteraeota bacterium]
MAQVELTVPDLGGFNDIPVIEVLVAPGETVAKDAPLVTLESDKATMEVPASEGGVVKELRVKIGDKVSQGTVLATIEAVESKPSPAPPTEAAAKDVAGIVASDAGASEEVAAHGTPVPLPAKPAVETMEKIVDLVVPDIGEFTDIPVIEVLVAAGDTVAKESALVTLESDKATMEVPASTGGVLRDVRVKVGDNVSKGTVIATVATTETSPAAPVATVPQAQAELTTRQGESRKNGAADVAVSPSKGANGTASSAVVQGTPVHASPAIRRFARELGVDLSHVDGSGPNGRITRDDVQGFVKTAIASPAPSGGVHAGTTSGLGLNLPPWPSVDFAKFGPVERVALTRIQKISGPVLARNWVMVPHVTQNEEADVTDLEAFRKQVNGERKDVKVTMLAFLMKAAVAALKRLPQFNASLDGDELVLKKYYHLGFAADTPNGLLVPVIRDVDKKGVIDIARETSELAGKARDGKLGPADMSGATFTISSLGSIGGTTFTPIINAPEVAILGACKADIRPVWDGTSFVPRLMQPLSLSYDHRVIDGANAARFAVEIKHALADLRRTLL